MSRISEDLDAAVKQPSGSARRLDGRAPLDVLVIVLCVVAIGLVLSAGVSAITTSDASVVGKVEGGGWGGSGCYPTVSYTVEGRDYVLHADKDPRWCGLHWMGPATVHYEPSDPAQARLSRYGDLPMHMAKFALIVAVIAAFLSTHKRPEATSRPARSGRTGVLRGRQGRGRHPGRAALQPRRPPGGDRPWRGDPGVGARCADVRKSEPVHRSPGLALRRPAVLRHDNPVPRQKRRTPRAGRGARRHHRRPRRTAHAGRRRRARPARPPYDSASRRHLHPLGLARLRLARVRLTGLAPPHAAGPGRRRTHPRSQPVGLVLAHHSCTDPALPGLPRPRRASRVETGDPSSGTKARRSRHLPRRDRPRGSATGPDIAGEAQPLPTAEWPQLCLEIQTAARKVRTRSMSSADASGSYASSEESVNRCWSPG